MSILPSTMTSPRRQIGDGAGLPCRRPRVAGLPCLLLVLCLAALAVAVPVSPATEKSAGRHVPGRETPADTPAVESLSVDTASRESVDQMIIRAAKLFGDDKREFEIDEEILEAAGNTVADLIDKADKLEKGELNETEAEGDGCEVIEELDIKMTCGQYMELLRHKISDTTLETSNTTLENVTKRSSGLKNLASRWPKGEVSYEISSAFSATDTSKITHAMAYIEENSCISFKKRSNERNYISIIKSGGCWSYVGMTGGRQLLSLDNGCVYGYIIQHEIMHALGFFHEQSRADRDEYVTVHLENMQTGMENNFNMYRWDQLANLNTSYDPNSVMHYSKFAFSDNGQPTLTLNSNPSATLGNNLGLSPTDIKNLNRLYECSNGAVCVDFVEHCSYWAQAGHCQNTHYAGYMKLNCPKSCKECGPGVEPVNGNWGAWSAYSACSASCGPGTRSRSRVCNSPAPAYGGATCPGDDTHTENCDMTPCPESLCGPEWSDVGDRCYRYYGQAMSYMDAKNVCYQQSSRVAHAASSEENEVLTSFMTVPSIWLGMTIAKSTGNWKLSNGQTPNYLNWNTGEPNNADSKKCAELDKNTGKWNAAQCDSGTNAFVCYKVISELPKDSCYNLWGEKKCISKSCDVENVKTMCRRTCGECTTDCYDTMPLKWCVDAREKNVCNYKKVKAKCKMTCGHC